MDKESGEPVPFASIAIVGTSRGTSSNLQGQFSISVTEPFSLMVSCIGYESQRVSSLEALKRIQLMPMATKLDAIVISNKRIQPKKIVLKAFSRIKGNYNPHPFMQQFFYRHYCKDDSVYGRLIEASVDVWKSRGYRSPQHGAGENEEIRITQLRRSADKTQRAQGHEPISVDDILETDLIGYQTAAPSERMSFYSNVNNLEMDLESYTFDFNGIVSYDGEEVYEISYQYKDTIPVTAGNYRVRMQVTGTLFITTDSYAFIKREEEKAYGKDNIRTTTYFRKYGNYYYPYHFVLEGESQTATDLHSFHIELMSVEIKTGEENKFTGKLPQQEELLDIPYDSAFWTTNTILKTTPLEDDIIRDLGGGTSLNKQFYRYHAYEKNVRNGGQNGEEKFQWLLDDSRGNQILYLVFWSGDLHRYLPELEKVKQLQQQYRNSITFVLLSLDDDQNGWQQTVQRFNLFSDGIINYRIGSHSSLAGFYHISHIPSFVLLSRKGEPYGLPARRPTDPLLLEDFRLLLDQNP